MAALDTNVLVHAEAVTGRSADPAKSAISRQLITTLMRAGTACFSVQTLAELHHVFTRKLRLSRADAGARIAELTHGARIVATTEAIFSDAVALSQRHNLQIFDAIILAAAAAERCDVLYSEDFQPGFAWRGVEVVNPFG